MSKAKEIPECVIIDAQHKIYEQRKVYDDAKHKSDLARKAVDKAEHDEQFHLEKLKEYAAFLQEHSGDTTEDWFAEVGLVNPDKCEHHDAKEAHACTICGAR